MMDDIEGLKPFDSCIEASDTLASTSTSSGRGVDNSTGLVDCSVLVSPDGELLIIPQQQNGKKEQQQGVRKSWCWEHDTQSNELGEEYHSAVFLGNDLPDQGDKAMNGFSTKGWSVAAASLALKQSADSMGDLSQLLEELVVDKKSSTTKQNQTIDKLRSMVGVEQSELKASKVAEYQQYLHDNFTAENLNQREKQRNFRRKKIKKQKQQQDQNAVLLEVSPDRVGPLNYSGGTIPATLKALGNYYSSLTESESKRLRNMSERSGALTKLRNATRKTEERVHSRQVAVQETMSRIKTMENYLQECKVDAKMKWDKVHETEMIVTQLVEEKMVNQNKIKEEERRKQMEEDEVERARYDKGKPGASTSEIWDLVSAATASMEEGSFEPVIDRKSTDSSIVSDDESPLDPTSFVPPEDIEMEMDSRYEFEVQYRLPELRVLALAADGAVEDAATSLLSILSNWDTTSRSAQVAAETCLLSSGNAQASCLRSIIATERESMEERLKLLEKLETVANEIDVRADVNEYITIDKTKQGGRSYRGEYDDGGIASALNHLHVDPGLGTDEEIDKKCCSDDDETEEEPDDYSSISPEYIEETLECFFRNDPLLRNKKAQEELEANVVKLCMIGEGKSPKYTTRRSTICYAMNAKRSTNAQIPSLVQFDGLCRVFTAVLSGCDTPDDGGISSAILLMGLSQHFHVQESTRETYVKSRLVGHSLWDKVDFWDRALHQTITEKLNYSSVLSNFECDSLKTMTTEKKERSEWTETHKTRWHDLTEVEQYQAASQVNAVVFAQVSAMTDSMLELCGNQEMTSAFVRRVCVKNELPMSQRTALLRHLTGGSTPVGNGVKKA
jgi:hypothetical protein